MTTQTTLTCKRCNSSWVSRKLQDKGEIPVRCPRCGSHVWMIPKNGKANQ